MGTEPEPHETPKVAIITGGGRGIGRAITYRLASHGWRCLIAGLDAVDLTETVAQADASDRVRSIRCDIATEEGRNALTHAWETSHGQNNRLDLLVNCAAQTTAIPLFAPSVKAWRDELDVNLVAIAVLSSWAIEQMKPHGNGSIVNIGSIYGSLALNGEFYEEEYPQDHPDGPTRIPAYHASKGAVAALTRDLAVAGGQWNIRINTISPGMIKTPERTFSEERVRKFAAATPLRRMGTVEDIASVVEFLASDDAAFVTGAEWVVDGGWSIW